MVDNDGGNNDLLQGLEYLWKEYEYRHSLIWELIFKFTGAIVLISMVPYVQIALVDTLGYLILVPPILAFALACFSVPVMWKELDLFGRIKRRYRKWQNRIVPARDPLHIDPSKFPFHWFVMAYFFFLVLLTAINLVVVAWLLYEGRFAAVDPASILSPLPIPVDRP